MSHYRLLKIVSGGQTGADLAALDFAIKFEIPHAGWCPKGRTNEKGKIPPIYSLKEAPLEDPACRTTLNILDSDGALVYTLDNESGSGTKLTHDLCILFNKPVLVVNISDKTSKHKLLVKDFLEHHKIETLNVAGNRESESPGIYKSTRIFLEHIFT